MQGDLGLRLYFIKISIRAKREQEKKGGLLRPVIDPAFIGPGCPQMHADCAQSQKEHESPGPDR